MDGTSLVGITQERAAEIMMHTGQVVEVCLLFVYIFVVVCLQNVKILLFSVSWRWPNKVQFIMACQPYWPNQVQF